MAESPTPETGTPESQSPARTPPALITTEELLQSMALKSPEGATVSSTASPGGSVSRRSLAERYEQLRVADSRHKLQGMRLPPEEELRAAALGGRPAVGPPPRLPHQLSPALQSVLLGWRSVYESCRTATTLQALVGDCYAQEAVFEDALVSARGQEAIYRQFALLGAAVRGVQVGAYSLSVAPLARPAVGVVVTGASAQAKGEKKQRQPRGGQGPQQQQVRPLHLTRVTVENVQCFNLGLPPWLSWLVGSKGADLQMHLYVTSVLLVASDAPLAEGAGTDVTASRLAGAAAALGGGGAWPGPPGVAGGGGDGGDSPAWRIVHQVDLWHNVPLVWWRLRRFLCVALDAVLSPLLGV